MPEVGQLDFGVEAHDGAERFARVGLLSKAHNTHPREQFSMITS